jgi:hypothetical protein
MSRAHILIAVGLLANGACAAARQPPHDPAVVAGEEAAAAPGGIESEPEVPQTLLETIVACRRVQDDSELPVECSTEFIDGMLTMMVGFESALDAAKYSGDLEARLSRPFCEAANGAGKSASVYVLVAYSARQFDCELGQWGSWFELVAEPERSPEASN